MIEKLKRLSKKELRNEFKIYLSENNYAKNSIGTFSSQALFLFDKLGIDNFWEIVESDDFEILARQSIHNELVKTGTQKYASGYLSNLRCFRVFCGIATAYNEREKIETDKLIINQHKVKKHEPTLSVSEAIEAIKKYHYSIDNNYTRYKSWEHCYNAFRMNRHDESKIDFLCLHLSCYLASWGMLRKSALINYDYLIHKDFVKNISDFKYDKLYDEDFNDVDFIFELVDLINSSYPSDVSKTDTFVTKILLGVFGCVPAYDRYFRHAVSNCKVCSRNFSKNSLKNLYAYYELHFDDFEKLRHQFIGEGVYYTPMKMIDMCFWQLGYDMENKI